MVRAVGYGRLADSRGRLPPGRRNLAWLRAEHPRGPVVSDLDAWDALLDGPLETLLDTLVSSSPGAVELR